MVDKFHKISESLLYGKNSEPISWHFIGKHLFLKWLNLTLSENKHPDPYGRLYDNQPLASGFFENLCG